MVRLSLLAVLVFCLMGQVECDSRSSSRDRDGQNREAKMYKPMLDELSDIKGILEEIKDLGTIAATRQLSQTQPEETQPEETQVAECPVCGMYETCNETSFECELKRCVSPGLINMVDTNITATTELYEEKFDDHVMLTTNFTKATTKDNYIQINFSDMKIVELFGITNNAECQFLNVTIETSENCENFTYKLTYDIGWCRGEEYVFQEPALARCVRVYPVGIKDGERQRVAMLGCSAQM